MTNLCKESSQYTSRFYCLILNPCENPLLTTLQDGTCNWHCLCFHLLRLTPWLSISDLELWTFSVFIHGLILMNPTTIEYGYISINLQIVLKPRGLLVVDGFVFWFAKITENKLCHLRSYFIIFKPDWWISFHKTRTAFLELILFFPLSPANTFV